MKTLAFLTVVVACAVGGCSSQDTAAAGAAGLAAPEAVSTATAELDTEFTPHQARDVMRAGRVQKPASPVVTNPQEAFLWQRSRLVDENGQIPPFALETAFAQRNANAAFWSQPYQARNAGIDSLRWVEKGPFNVGGRTRSMLIHPTQTNRIWSGSVGGGIWYSSDSGVNWAPVNDFLQNLAVCSMAFQPGNANIMYAGTGEGFFNGDAIGGTGIYKSIDGGVTWTLMPSTAGWDNVCRIAINPSNTNIMLVSKKYGGILRSTDGGLSWTTVYAAQASFQVLLDPTNPAKGVAHIINSDGQWFHHVVYTTDSGATWNVSGGLSQDYAFNSRIELAYAPSSPNIVYASCALNGGVIWRSTDGGQNFSLRTTSGVTGVGWYYNSIWVDPTNPNFLLAGAYHVHKSTDGGVTLNQLTDGYILTAAPHPDVHVFVHDPAFNGVTNRRVYVCGDGGMHKTENIYTATADTGWTSLQPRYRASQFYGAQGHAASGRIVGGTQDNGTLRLTSASSNATLTFGGDGGFCAIDSSNSMYMYGEYVNLQIHRSTNGGSSASYIYSGIGDAGTGNANFIAPFILDPNDPAVLLAGGRQLWRTPNARSAPVAWFGIGPTGLSSNISAIAVAQGNSNIIWVGLNNGQVWRTTNGNNTTPVWNPVDNNSAPDPLPNRYINRIVIDPANHSKVYVTQGGFNGDNVRQTTNNGVSFQDITGAGATGLPSVPVYGLARHPSKPGHLYAATHVGVFASNNDGATWSTTNDGPANVRVDEIAFMHGANTLVAATHGRGMWTIDVVDCPVITTHPANTGGLAGGQVMLSVGATGPSLTYQWRKGMVNLTNDARISGATSSSMTITGLVASDAGSYDVVVTNVCGGVTSNAATVSVTACGTADFDGDGDTGTDADIEAFFACVGGNCCGTCGSADFNGDGDTGTDVDIEAFFRVLGGGAC